MKAITISVAEIGDVYRARSMGRETAASIGFDKTAVYEIETAISELATNIIKHAKKGEITIKTLNNNGKTGIEILSEDEGPGIRDISKIMEGGVSTAGTLGIGLSGVRRLMDEFSIDSDANNKTVITAKKRLFDEKLQEKMAFSVLARPKPGEDVSGDEYFIKRASSDVLFGVIDVLGHGKEAHHLAQDIIRMLEDNHSSPLIQIVDACHKGLRYTRGAAMALCRVRFGENVLEHIGIGNVETKVYGTPSPVRPFCFNGTLGMSMETHRVIEYPYSEGMTVLMFSDGVSGRFDLASPMLIKSPQEIASYIFNNYSRSTDDATVLVGR